MKTQIPGIIQKIIHFYYIGFSEMTIGKKLWMIILIKVLVIFVFLKLFFFPDFMNANFNTDLERSDYIIEQLTNQ